MPEELALDQIRRDRSAVDLHKRARLARAQVVNRSGDQFLACPSVSPYEDRRIRGRDLFDLSEHGHDALTLADDLLEIVLGLDLFTKVEILSLKSILELCDLRKELRVLDRNGCLVGKDRQPLEFLFTQRPSPEHRDDAEQLPMEFQRVAGKGVEPIVFHPLFVGKSVVAEYVVRVHRSEALGDFSDLERPQRDATILPIEIGVEPGARLKVQAAIPIRTVCRFVTIGAEIAGT